MDPNTGGPTEAPRMQSGQMGHVDDRCRDENRQPEMSEPFARAERPGAEPVFWLVPDTRDDIVVSRIGDG